MHTRNSTLLIALLMFIAAGCGSSDKNANNTLTKKKADLQAKIAQKAKLETEINALQQEIAGLDKSASVSTNAKLISVSSVVAQHFDHYIDLRGRIDAENISYITPRGMGGQVKVLMVKEGDKVSKGQLLLKLDDAILRQNLTAARQQLEGIKTQLNFASTVYERQKNLWEKGIGTEIQLINAKTNMETLQNQLKSADAQINVLNEQIKTTSVYSDVDGVAETVMVKVGELFSGMGQIKIVNTSHLKAIANVPENYLTRIQKGTPVEVEVTDAGKKYSTIISLIGQTIENAQRGFTVEAKIPSDNTLKPNQSAVIRILDYKKDNAVVIPVNTIQSDEHSKYVYVMEKNAKGQSVASRKTVEMGEVYNDKVEIKSGLTGGEQLITEGYQSLYEGQLVNVTQ